MAGWDTVRTLALSLPEAEEGTTYRKPAYKVRGKTFAWLASVRDDHGVDWTMPNAERYRCVDDPLPTGLVA